MAFKSLLYAAWLALAGSVSAHNLHLGTKGLLQIAPSFSGDGITMYPAHRPGHDPEDLIHLKPQDSHELYYSQEGHRPALHGAKHGSMQAKFVRPTVVLDHSSHLQDVKCSDKHIDICFKTQKAFETVHESWHINDFNLVTYHLGCGDQTSGKRSFFHASHPVFNANSTCLRVAADPIGEHEALDSVKLTWGTFKHPDQRKRVPTKGHVRVARSDLTDPTQYGNGTGAGEVDLNHNATAIKNFFANPDIDTSDVDAPVDPAEEPDFISMNGTVARRHVLNSKRGLGDDIVNFFKGLWNGIKSFFNTVADYFKAAVAVVRTVATTVIELGVVAAKLIAVPFGVPFNHSYHNDFKLHKYLTAESTTNRPPKVFGIGDGFNLASSGSIYSVQCAKCGIHADFTVDGQLAFSIKDGITEGKVSLENNDPFTIDAQFGITIEQQKDKAIEKLTKQLAAVPLSPLTIPGIITLGPQASISVAMDLILNGKAELLVGGSFSIQPGVAALSLVHKEENKLEGLEVNFTPVLKAQGALTATAELGLPVALEVGLDVLNGKFKKTVGLVNKPSVYASATYSVNEGHKCDQGVELRAGVKNRIYVAALDLWDYDIRTDILYEKGIACVTSDGFDTSAVEPDQSVFTTVTDKLDGDIGTQPSNITDVASTLKSSDTKTGFRVIMDEDKSSILVSGEDGYIYLVKTDENYDLSAPWGTIDVNSNTVDLDVFGRIMSNKLHGTFVTEIKVNEVDKVPADEKAASLSILKTDEKDYQTYGVTFTVDPKITSDGRNLVLWYPTFCKTDKGLRLYGTRLMQDKDGYYRNTNVQFAKEATRIFNSLGINRRECHTVRLTSKIQGA